MSTLNVDKVDPSTGTALELGTSGDTITVPTGAGLTVTDEVKTNKISPATGTAFALGDSGDTFTLPSGATIVNSGTATGFGGGKILQVVNDQDVGTTTNTTTSFADSGGSIAITPSATSSLVLVHISIPFYMYRGSGASCRFAWQILRGVTVIAGDTVANDQGVLGASAEWVFGFPWNYSYYDNPSTTSATTYKCQFKNLEAGSIITQVNGSKASMTAMEIDGS